jgi:hypothetical protein
VILINDLINVVASLLVLQEEGVFNVLKSKLIIEQVVEFFFIFKKVLEVFLLRSLVHHGSAARHHLHLFNRFCVLQKHAQNTV